MWDKIPSDLSSLNQWLLADKKGAPCDIHLRNVSLAECSNFLSYQEAATAAKSLGAMIGFVITESDPFTCIDIDVIDEERQRSKGQQINPTKWSTPEDFDRYWRIVQKFDSYTERSRSGKGLHVWLRGKAERNCARDGVDLRSKNMFVICTGDIVLQRPIIARQEILNTLFKEINIPRKEVELVDVAQTKSDDDIWRIASSAENGEKFIKLCEADIADMGYPSQSEADLALMSIFAFYSQSNEQCRRMFRMTKLGMRNKAQDSDVYLNRTLRGIRARQKDEDYVHQVGANMAANLLKSLDKAPTNIKELIAEKEILYSNPVNEYNQSLEAAIGQVIGDIETERGGLSWPPGIVGEVARYMNSFAPRPVKEVAIASALGLFAGICGKSFNLPKTGLNIYIILVAKSGVGKESLHTGISAITKQLPELNKFIEFSEFASGQALTKALSERDTFVNVQGEFGKLFRRFSNSKDTAAASLRTVLTNMYQKSSAESNAGGLRYSNQDKNTGVIGSVAFSMIGETTPGTLNESITSEMMEDGFLSRFLIIEYTGLRAELNLTEVPELPERLKTVFANLAQRADRESSIVGMTDETKDLSYQFDKICDERINSTDDETFRQLWNRAHLKAIKIAGLLAAANASSAANALMTRDMLEWSIDIVERNIQLITRRIRSGEIGITDGTRYNAVLSSIEEYLKKGPRAGYGVDPNMAANAIITKSYFQKRLAGTTAFVNHRAGSKIGLDVAINNLIENGILIEVPKSELVINYQFQGKAYRIISGF